MADLTCQQVQEKLLSAESVEGVFAAHVQHCPECGPLAAKLMRLETAARQMPVPAVIGPSEAFLEQVRGLRLPERGAAMRRVMWVRRSAAAAIIVAVGLMALSVCLMNARTARADTILRDLVSWNLQIGASHDPAERQKLYEQKVAGLKQEIAAAGLSQVEAQLADALLQNAEWLENANDRLAEAAHFAAIAKQMKSAGMNMSEMDALQKDLVTRGVQGNLQQVQPEQLSPEQKQQLQQLQNQSSPGLPASAPVAPQLPATQNGAMRLPPSPVTPLNGNAPAAPHQALASVSSKVIGGVSGTGGNTTAFRMLPPAGTGVPNDAPAKLSAAMPGNFGWTAAGGGHSTGSSMGSAAAPNPGTAVPGPASGNGGSAPGQGWATDSDDWGHDAQNRMTSTSPSGGGMGLQVAPARAPVIGGVARDGDFTVHAIPSNITGPTVLAQYFAPPPHGATSLDGSHDDGDTGVHQIQDNGGVPGKNTASGGSTVASTTSGGTSASQGNLPPVVVPVLGTGGLQHMVALGDSDDAPGSADDSNGDSNWRWHHWKWQQGDGPGNGDNGWTNGSWTPGTGSDGQTTGAPASGDAGGWTGWQNGQGSEVMWQHSTSSGGQTLTPVQGVTFSAVIVPEPAAGMIAIGGIMMLLMRRRRAR